MKEHYLWRYMTYPYRSCMVAKLALLSFDQIMQIPANFFVHQSQRYIRRNVVGCDNADLEWKEDSRLPTPRRSILFDTLRIYDPSS